MGDGPAVRAAEAGDEERIRAVAERSATASYDLSPRERDTLVDAVFGESTQRRARNASDAVVFVAELDGEVAGVAVGSRAAPDGTLRWLHVDPDCRGRGVGTALFKRTCEAVEEHGPGGPRVAVAAANREGSEFVERFGFERADERETEFDGLTLRERWYAPAGTTDADGDEDAGEGAEVPDTASADGATVYLGEERIPATDAPFVRTYTDEGRREEHGYYCTNCASTAVAVDSMETVECDDCGNVHQPEEYDGAYL